MCGMSRIIRSCEFDQHQYLYERDLKDDRFVSVRTCTKELIHITDHCRDILGILANVS